MGYRARSARGTQFCQWATANLSEYQDLEARTQGGFDISDLEGLYHPFSREYKRLPALCDALWSFFKSVSNKLDCEQYREVLAPKFVKGNDGEEYDERQKLWPNSAKSERRRE